MAKSEAVEADSRIYDDDGRTIMPEDIRKALGIEAGQKIEWIAKNGNVMLAPADEE